MPIENTDEMQEAIVESLREIEAGDRTSNNGFRDENLVALFAALEKTDNLEYVCKASAEHLGRDLESSSKSEALGHLVRVGLQQVAPETLEIGTEGYKEYLINKSGKF